MLSEVYGDRMASQCGGASDGESFPLQQRLLVCCLLLLTRHGKSKEVVLGKVRRRPARHRVVPQDFYYYFFKNKLFLNGVFTVCCSSTRFIADCAPSGRCQPSARASVCRSAPCWRVEGSSP